VHGLEHLIVQVLHPQAQAVEAQLGQHPQAGSVHRAGIDLDRVIAARRQGEVASQHRQQLPQFVIGQEGRRAAAQVQLGDGLAGAKLPGRQLHLAFQAAQVVGRPLVLPGDDLVA